MNDDQYKELNSEFHKLSRKLSDNERLSLLRKLQNTTENDDLSQPSEALNRNPSIMKSTKTSFAMDLFKSFDFFHKLMLYLKAFILGNELSDLVIQGELNALKRHIKEQNAKVINFDEKKLTNHFISTFIPLIEECFSVKHIFSKFESDSVYYYEFIANYIERQKSEEIGKEMEMLSPDSLEKSMNFLDKNNYLSEKNMRINRYFKTINVLQIDSLNNNFKKFILFLKLQQFEYDKLLNFFFISNIDVPVTDRNYSVLSEDILLLLKKLYRILYSINFSYDEILIFEDFFYYFETELLHDLELEEQADTSLLKESLRSIFDSVERIKKVIPFESIFQYFDEDLLYKTKPIKIDINLVDLYKAYKKTIVDKLWDKNYAALKRANILKLLDELFLDHRFDYLTRLNEDLKDRIERYSELNLKDFYLLNLLGKFLSIVFKPKISEIVNKLIVDGNFIKDSTKTSLSSAYYTLKSAEEKIKSFDKQFKTGSGTLSKINNAILRIRGDHNYKYMLVNIVNDLNEDSFKVKFEINEALKVVTDTLKVLIDPNKHSRYTISNFHSIKTPYYATSKEAVEYVIETCDKFTQVYLLVRESF